MDYNPNDIMPFLYELMSAYENKVKQIEDSHANSPIITNPKAVDNVIKIQKILESKGCNIKVKKSENEKDFGIYIDAAASNTVNFDPDEWRFVMSALDESDYFNISSGNNLLHICMTISKVGIYLDDEGGEITNE